MKLDIYLKTISGLWPFLQSSYYSMDSSGLLLYFGKGYQFFGAWTIERKERVFSGDRFFSFKKRKGTGATVEAGVCYRKKMAVSLHIRFFLVSLSCGHTSPVKTVQFIPICLCSAEKLSYFFRFFLSNFPHCKREHDNKCKPHTEIHLLQSSNGMIFKPKHPINPAVHPLYC